MLASSCCQFWKANIACSLGCRKGFWFETFSPLERDDPVISVVWRAKRAADSLESMVTLNYISCWHQLRRLKLPNLCVWGAWMTRVEKFALKMKHSHLTAGLVWTLIGSIQGLVRRIDGLSSVKQHSLRFDILLVIATQLEWLAYSYSISF